MSQFAQGDVQFPSHHREIAIRPRPPKQPAPPQSAVLALDADTATNAHHEAAADIAGTWKGYSVRRKLASEEIYSEHRRKHAIRIQCCFRRFQARRKVAALRFQRDELIGQKVETYNHSRLVEIKPAANWQKKQFEQAARLIQAVYKWYLQKRDASMRGEDRSTIPYPLRKRRKSALLPYRRKTLMYRNRCLGGGSVDHSLAGTPNAGLSPLRPLPPSSAPAGARRASRSGKDSSLQQQPLRASSVSETHTKGSRALVTVPTSSTEICIVPPAQHQQHHHFRGPPTQEEVEEANSNRRRKEQEVRELLASPPQQVRIDKKRQGIDDKDFDHCASVLQRRFRTVMAKQEVHSRQCLTEYNDRYATVIQCAFRMFVAKRRATHLRRKLHGEAYLRNRRYEMQQVGTMTEEYSWNAHVMNAAAKILQTAFRRYYARRTWTQGKTTHPNVEAYMASDLAPPPLPLGLLKNCPPHKKSTMQSNSNKDLSLVRGPVFRRHHSRKRKDNANANESTKEDGNRTEEEETKAAEEGEAVNATEEGEAAALGDAAVEGDADPAALTMQRPVPTEEERERAALRIQCAFRQHMARRAVNEKRVKRREAFEQANLTDAARTIQAAHRRKHNSGSDGGSSNSSPKPATGLPEAAPVVREEEAVTMTPKEKRELAQAIQRSALDVAVAPEQGGQEVEDPYAEEL